MLFVPKRNFSRISEGLENCLPSNVCPVLILHSSGKREFKQNSALCKSSSEEGAAEFKTVGKDETVSQTRGHRDSIDLPFFCSPRFRHLFHSYENELF